MEIKIKNNTIYKSIKNMKCSGINLTRDVQALYPENYKVCLRQIKFQINGEIHHVHESEDSMLSTSLSIDLMLLQSKSQQGLLYKLTG